MIENYYDSHDEFIPEDNSYPCEESGAVRVLEGFTEFSKGVTTVAGALTVAYKGYLAASRGVKKLFKRKAEKKKDEESPNNPEAE